MHITIFFIVSGCAVAVAVVLVVVMVVLVVMVAIAGCSGATMR